MSTASSHVPTLTTWNVDASHSHVEFAVRHLMITTVRGRFADVRGTLRVDDIDLTTAEVDVSIGTASIDTREPQRDAHLRSADFFDVENFPEIRFRSTRVDHVSADRYRVTGALTIRGVTHDVVLDTTAEGRGKDPWGGERLGFSATTRINRSAFGLTWNQLLEAGGVAVGDEIKITIDVELIKAK
jgi:polyisoprenoid-binding protein YceI